MVDSITIETLTSCNAKCIICPNQFKPRPHYLMPLDEFEAILRFFPDLKGVVLCGMYEPLLDKRLHEILSIIKKLQPQAAVTIFTNGSLLTLTKSHMLLSHCNLKNLVVSIHGLSKEAYESIMVGLNRDKVYKNVLSFMKMLDYKLLEPPKVSVSFVRIKQNIHELEAFRNFWKDKVDVVSDYEIMNWNGAVPNFQDLLYEIPQHARPCPMFEQPLVIDAFGNIVKCCYDFFWNYGHVLKGGYERWLKKKRESETYPLSDCKACYGWKHY